MDRLMPLRAGVGIVAHSIPNRLTGRSIEGGMRLRQADCTRLSLVVSEPYVDVFKRGDERRDKCEC